MPNLSRQLQDQLLPLNSGSNFSFSMEYCHRNLVTAEQNIGAGIMLTCLCTDIFLYPFHHIYTLVSNVYHTLLTYMTTLKLSFDDER